MKIIIVDIHPPRGFSFSRAYEAMDLIKIDVPIFLPDLRVDQFFSEIRKLLFYARYDAALNAWDDQKLNQLEQQIGFVDIRARFPHRWSVSKPLTAQLAVEVIEQAFLDGLPVIKFYVDWYPFGPVESAVRAAFMAEERVTEFVGPYWLQVSSKSYSAVQVIRERSTRLPCVRKRPKRIQSSQTEDDWRA